MPPPRTRLILLLLAISLDAAAEPPCAPRALWKMSSADYFNWRDDSSRSTPAGQYSFGFNSVIAGSNDANVLRLYVRPNALDRTKVAVSSFPPYASGIYRWRVLIPQFAPDTRAGIGAFLYAAAPYNEGCNVTSANCHELDFEVGYGDRSSRPAGLASDVGIMMLTGQWFVTAVTFPPSVARCGSRAVLPCLDHAGRGGTATLRLPVTLGRWYDLTLTVRRISGRLYEASWAIDGATKMVAQLDMHDLPASIDVPWNIEASLETFSIYGSQLPSTFFEVFFDEIEYTPLCDAPGRRRVVTRR